MLQGADAWITGQRKEQAITREALEFKELDAARNMLKFNPLFDWSQEDVWAYVKTRQVPIHPLHTQGYASIGCEPCTRAIKATEDVRAGRWWWLQSESKECGLHVTPAVQQEVAEIIERVAQVNSALPSIHNDYLDWLEAESIYIIREVVGQCTNPAMLFSGGKDSIVMFHLARKAFRFGKRRYKAAVPPCAYRHGA